MEKDPFVTQRLLMVELIKRRGILLEPLLKSMSNLPRHLFVPGNLQKQAYEDTPLPIGEGQTISQPYIVALMLQHANLSTQSRILDIGTGSGYSAAVAAPLVSEVYTIERIPELAQQAEERFKKLGLTNVTTRCGDGSLGWVDAAPFDAILVAAGAPVVPKALVSQLGESGVLVIPVGDAGSQKLLRITRGARAGEWREELIELVRFVPLIGEEGWKP